MLDQHKTIRSSDWKTDFLIGFPEGLLLLFFTTQLTQAMDMTVQTFYTLNACIWAAGSLLVMITSYRANRGDSQHEESGLTPQERIKLQRLDIGENIIADIEEEMARDASQWEKTLQEEHVQVSSYHAGKALRSALLTGIFFLVGGALPFQPYLRNEYFPSAARGSVILTFIVIFLFGLLKSRMTGLPAGALLLRNLLYTAAVWLGAYIVQLVFV